MNRLVKFEEHMNYGILVNVFVCDEELWRLVQKHMRKQTVINFGSALGKHSEVRTTLSEESITIVSEDQDFITTYDKLLGNLGNVDLPNELYDIEERDCDDDLDDDDEEEDLEL